MYIKVATSNYAVKLACQLDVKTFTQINKGAIRKKPPGALQPNDNLNGNLLER